jgi:outer membrane protein insertion porin family
LTEQELILLVRGRGGFVHTYDDTDRVPLQERVFLGGPTSFRGANFRKLSPKDPVTGERIGGNKFTLFTTEVGMPIVKDFVQIGAVIFFDAANVIAQDKSFDTDFEYAFGVGTGVVTPFGPIRIDVAYNPNPRADDDEIIIHFNVGRSF